MDDENEPGEGTTQEPEQVQVEFSEDTDIDSFLENATKAEAAGEQPGAPELEPDPELDTEEELEARATPSAPEQEAPNESTQKEVTREEFDRLQRQLEGQELLIKRRTSELGDIRKNLQGLIAEKAPGLREKYDEDPASATNDLLEIREAQKQIKELDVEASELQRQANNQRAILNHIDVREVSLDDVADVFRSDGVDATAIENFKRNPWAADPIGVIQAAKRAKAEKYLRVLVPAFQKLREENAKLKGSKGDVLKQVERVARELPGVTGKSGGATITKEQDYSDIPTHEMTDAQLDAMLKKASRSK